MRATFATKTDVSHMETDLLTLLVANPDIARDV